MNIDTKNSITVAIGNVVIINKDVIATGDRATYYEDEEKLVITGNADNLLEPSRKK